MALGDLDVAQRLNALGEVHPSYICFHAQQAAEKALKGLIAAFELNIPRTRDLARLIGLLPPFATEWIRDATLLTPYAVASRYPDDPEEYDEDSGTQATTAASRICEAVRQRLR